MPINTKLVFYGFFMRSVEKITKFNSKRSPGIPIRNYIKRIGQYAKCSENCYILALIYLDKMMEKAQIFLSELNIHRLVLTGILIAIKYLDDFYYDNEYYAKVGGIPLRELNDLESEMLTTLDFRVHIKPEIFEKYKTDIEVFIKEKIFKTKQINKYEEEKMIY